MASIGQSLFVLLCFVQSGTAIQCLICQSFGHALDPLSQTLYRNYDRRCEDNPSAATSFGECSGSCYYLRVSQSLTKTDTNAALNSRDWVRGCLATTSVEEGCMNLTLANLEDIQNILPNSVSTVTAMEGRLCVCNSDRCNVDTTSLVTLPQVPAVQCPKCEYMEYSSSDFMVQLLLGLIGHWFLGEMDQKCVSSPTQTKTVSCRGSCLSSVGEGTMSASFVTVTMKLTERLCSPSKSADGCSRLTDSDAAMTGLFTLDALTGAGLQSHTTSAEVCTCNQDGCTRPMTTVSSASTTTTTPTGSSTTTTTPTTSTTTTPTKSPTTTTTPTKSSTPTITPTESSTTTTTPTKSSATLTRPTKSSTITPTTSTTTTSTKSSTTQTRPTKSSTTRLTPSSITQTRVTPDNHVSTTPTTPHSTNKPKHYNSLPATGKSTKPTHSTTTLSSKSTTGIKETSSSAVTATHKPQTSSSCGVCSLELLLTTLMAAMNCMLWC